MKKRLLAFFSDLIIFSFVGVFIFFTITFDSIIYDAKDNINKPFETFYPILVGMLLIICNKDIVQGRSIGKRLNGIAVRELTRLDKPPGILRLFLRNVFLLVWPIGVTILLAKGKRLGDILIRTQVIEIKKNDILH